MEFTQEQLYQKFRVDHYGMYLPNKTILTKIYNLIVTHCQPLLLMLNHCRRGCSSVGRPLQQNTKMEHITDFVPVHYRTHIQGDHIYVQQKHLLLLMVLVFNNLHQLSITVNLVIAAAAAAAAAAAVIIIITVI